MMTRILAVEPVAPMSAIRTEMDIIEENDGDIISKNWKGQFIKLTPSSKKDGETIYRVSDQSFDLSKLKGR